METNELELKCQAYVEWFHGNLTRDTTSDQIGRLCGKPATTDAKQAGNSVVGPICEECFIRIKKKIAPKRLYRFPLTAPALTRVQAAKRAVEGNK